MGINERQQQIIDEFSGMSEWEDRYKRINIKPVDAAVLAAVRGRHVAIPGRLP